MNAIIEQNGSHVAEFGGLSAEASTAIALARAEIDTQIATALKYPRDIKRVMARIMTFATLDPETAAECCYALVFGKERNDQDGASAGRENGAVEGPSIRLAEIALQAYGNCRAYARVVDVDRKNKVIVAEGVFLDLETNAMQTAQTRRRIAGARGNLYPEHLIITTGNAACAIAKRNAILSGIPRALYRPSYNEARRIIAGEEKTISETRAAIIKSYATKGVGETQILDLLGLRSMLEFTTDHAAQMRAMWQTIKSGEHTVEEIFSPPKSQRQESAKDVLSNEGAPDHAKHDISDRNGKAASNDKANRSDVSRGGNGEAGSGVQDETGSGAGDGDPERVRGEAGGNEPATGGDDEASREEGGEGEVSEAAAVSDAVHGRRDPVVTELVPLEGDWRKPDGIKLAELSRDLDAAETAKAVQDVAEKWDNFITYGSASIKAKCRELMNAAKDRTKPKRGKL